MHTRLNRRRVAATTATTVALGLALAAPVIPASATGTTTTTQTGPAQAPTRTVDELDLQWRNVGPIRGGRSIAVGGSTARPNEYYFGATGGGLFRTVDAGETWTPVTDHQIGSSSIGAVAVCEANPDVVYIGGGEVQLRGDIIHGDGIYKSTDGGNTWTHLGLADTQTVSRIRVHPTDCDTAYAAVLGHPFGPNEERGVFRTTDGGASWDKTLYRDNLSGAADLTLDPGNPDIIYASLWNVYRKPWLMNSGGPGSGLFKSTDGGQTWQELSGNAGFADSPLGKIGVSVSGADSNRVYAIVEAKDGGVFSSDDGGTTWTRTSDNADLRQRAFYYTRLVADPQDKDTVYVLNVRFWKSTDGGRTFSQIPTPHGDNHDLWIAPEDNQRMVEGNDGGGNVTTDGGASWTAQDYSTSQMYHVTTTNEEPYYVCGSQQDNSTACVSSQGIGDQIYQVGGGESGYLAVDPRDSNIIYGGSYGGYLTRYDRRTGQARNVNPWPDNPMGHPAQDLKERFQWTFPIMTSPADPRAVYSSSQHVFRSTNDGQSWDQISPDLTRADPATLGDSGGPITKDQTSIEYYATVFALEPSPIEQKVIWAGSDDGLVHVTRNGGRTWDDVTPPQLPVPSRVSMIDAGQQDPAVAYVAAHRYRLDDRAPYLYRTDDFGKTWHEITTGIEPGAFAWSVREDPQQPGLLYAGTEHGIYVSLDNGGTWEEMAANIPDTQVSDITIHDDDVVVSTHGRGFYILDDGAAVLRSVASGAPAARVDALAGAAEQDRKASTAAEPGAADEWSAADRGSDLPDRQQYATGAVAPPMPPVGQPRTKAATADPAAPASGTGGDAPAASADGVVLHDPADPLRTNRAGMTFTYELAQPAQEVTLEVLDRRGSVVRTLPDAPADAGQHEVRWDLRYTGPVSFPNLIMWAASPTRGPRAPLGGHTVRLVVDGTDLTQSFTITEPDGLKVSPGEILLQVQLAQQIVDATGRANQGVIDVRACRTQVADRMAATDDSQVHEQGTALAAALTAVEEELYQTRLRSGQDPLNYPIKLNNRIAALLGVVESAEARPTDQSHAVFELLDGLLAEQLDILDGVIATDVPEFNRTLANAGLEAIDC